MRDCIQKVIAELRTMQCPNIQETLLEATLLMEKFVGRTGWRGISPNVDDAEVSSETITELRQTLIDFTLMHPEHPDVGTAISALGKLYDQSLRNFFLTELRRHYDARRVHPVWQADCALEDLGDGVAYEYAPGEATHEKYFQAVGEYLQRHGL